MPGGLLYSFRQGNRTEYLANYLLSALGIAVLVPRPEDVGIDFHCNLASDFGDGLLQFFAPYNVQIKSSSETKEKIKYGGVKNGKSKEHEVRWLLTQRTPFFLGLVDKAKGELRLYSLANRWFLKYEKHPPCEVTFVTDTIGDGKELNQESIKKSRVDLLESQTGMTAEHWEIPIGSPILTINSEQAEDPIYLMNTRNHFKDFIYADEQNGVFAGIGLPSFQWPMGYDTNGCLMVQGVAIGWESSNSHNLKKQERTLAILAASMQRTYQMKGEMGKAEILGRVSELIPDGDNFELVRRIMEDTNKMLSTEGATDSPSMSAESYDFELGDD